jgi:hypothetical protein
MNRKSLISLVISLLISLCVIPNTARPQAPSRRVAKALTAQSLSDRNVVLQSGGRPPLITSVNGGWLAGVPDPDPDADEPDKAAWQLFIAINQLASSQQTIGGNTTNNALWETWADDPLTFPASPNPANPPQWPSAGQTFPFLKRLQIPTQFLFRELQKQNVPPSEIKSRMLEFQRARPGMTLAQTLKSQASILGLKPLHIPLIELGGGEEVRRNKASFDFIVSNGLWYKQGLAAAFAAKNAITFPVDAIQVKADWIQIQPQQKSQYHWNYAADGKLYGLVALHIESKALPNWLWATFEWTGNAGRCDYIGCNDSFGVTPPSVAPATPVGGTYPAGTLTPALLSLMSAAGLGPEFQNYRLKGSQTLFANTVGQPTLLGSSVIEKGVVPSSSCITCHGQASVDLNGNNNPSLGYTPLSGLISSNGPLTPSMFFTSSDCEVATGRAVVRGGGQNGVRTCSQLQYFPIDFLWGIIRAN